MTLGIPVLSKGLQEAFLAIRTKSNITGFLMALHTIALALPDVKSTNVTIYNLSLNKAFRIPHSCG